MGKFETLPYMHRMIIFFYCAATSLLSSIGLGLMLDLSLRFSPSGILFAGIVLFNVGLVLLQSYICSMPSRFYQQYEMRRSTFREKAAFYAIPTGAGMMAGIALALFVLSKTIL
ncbi:hypothetical protein [uncultured Oscillibacter sp.]|uniref:hypothetical protein n=1 Tax=uncultured Oscillibacter sp. TaxID=876091 RepID=UPI002630D4B5|nr:hypothetical protein [uncultured Oscillibacter sp.]